MHERSMPAVGQLDPQAATPVEIGRGYHGTIELDPVSGVVCKQFRTDDTSEAAELVQREFECLRRFSTALTGQPFLRCPEPVRMDPEQGRVWMTHVPGSQLDHILAATNNDIDEHLEHIAGQLAIALESYVSELNEPYYDFATKHVLFDMPTRSLNLIDFTSRRRHRQSGSKRFPYETSLGIFIGLSTHDTVSRTMWRNKAYWKRQEQISSALLARLSARHELSLALVHRITHDVYAHGRTKGRPLRRFWARTAGQSLFNRRSTAIVAGVALRRD